MYVRRFYINMTLDSGGAANGYTSDACNGLLQSIAVRAGFAGTTAVASSLKLFRERSSGTTELALFRLTGPSSTWKEYFPRADVRYSSGGATTAMSTQLQARFPLDGRIYGTFASSSGLSGKALTVELSVI
ncbi:MAG: hypothetical protein DRH17_09825 [Deltaproteobacteria bacterium]|nr:MAG: hypothetical protein DRH17_09825 [Deltaproteobacteria bacterium]